jgi:hypothetical protein
VLTVARTNHALVGVLLGCCAQTGRSSLFKACARGHVAAVMLLLAQPNVDVNQPQKVQWRREGREGGGMGGCGVGWDC